MGIRLDMRDERVRLPRRFLTSKEKETLLREADAVVVDLCARVHAIIEGAGRAVDADGRRLTYRINARFVHMYVLASCVYMSQPGAVVVVTCDRKGLMPARRKIVAAERAKTRRRGAGDDPYTLDEVDAFLKQGLANVDLDLPRVQTTAGRLLVALFECIVDHLVAAGPELDRILLVARPTPKGSPASRDVRDWWELTEPHARSSRVLAQRDVPPTANATSKGGPNDGAVAADTTKNLSALLLAELWQQRPMEPLVRLVPHQHAVTAEGEIQAVQAIVYLADVGLLAKGARVAVRMTDNDFAFAVACPVLRRRAGNLDIAVAWVQREDTSFAEHTTTHERMLVPAPRKPSMPKNRDNASAMAKYQEKMARFEQEQAAFDATHKIIKGGATIVDLNELARTTASPLSVGALAISFLGGDYTLASMKPESLAQLRVPFAGALKMSPTRTMCTMFDGPPAFMDIVRCPDGTDMVMVNPLAWCQAMDRCGAVSTGPLPVEDRRCLLLDAVANMAHYAGVVDALDAPTDPLVAQTLNMTHDGWLSIPTCGLVYTPRSP